ncbi:hypothetical protein EGI16_11740 [Chryseobacterium sp. G0240]|uniref:hypothetical protein n=1 Tax=Chryseobacterium sp. G0240 TaxID=2487066 RepID=UPI000F448028|nr:hypothetical protein [Chryseobacterium sp. G0240]ROI03235.1 hypothetical protein EGI16_11740 [Chryseobacterium sp. G0240]
MKKIAYIEIDTHAEIARAFIDIMRGSKNFAADYYFSKKIKDQIGINDENIFLSDSSMIVDQLKDKNYDLIIIGTVHRYFNTFLAITGKYRTAIVTHNLNFTKTSKLNLIKSIFKGDVIYRLKLWWKEGLLNSSEVYRKSQSLFVLDEAMTSDKHLFLPLFYTKPAGKNKNQHLMVVIPGGVSQKRRDYYDLFQKIQNLNIDENIEFVFLGKAKDKELTMLESLSARVPDSIRITYFSERVPAETFDQWMQKADVLWCPIQQDTEFFSLKETYGVTKMTGNLGDAIVYGKWAVFPQNYPAKLDFIVPEQKDLPEQWKNLSKTHFDFQKIYNKEEVRKKLEALLSSLIPV